MNTKDAIALARRHVGTGAVMDSSARVCLADAISHHDQGAQYFAVNCARRSLKYSVGIMHPDFVTVDRFLDTVARA